MKCTVCLSLACLYIYMHSALLFYYNRLLQFAHCNIPMSRRASMLSPVLRTKLAAGAVCRFLLTLTWSALMWSRSGDVCSTSCCNVGGIPVVVQLRQALQEEKVRKVVGQDISSPPSAVLVPGHAIVPARRLPLNALTRSGNAMCTLQPGLPAQHSRNGAARDKV